MIDLQAREAAPEFDQATSKKLARQIGARPKECWRNAVLALVALPAEAVYVEGWIAFSLRHVEFSIPIEHGWVELGGRIIDPTLTGGDNTYFAGVRYSQEAIVRAVGRGKLRRLPIVHYFGPGLMRLPRPTFGAHSAEYQAAYEAASQAAGFPSLPLRSYRLLSDSLDAAARAQGGRDA